MENEDFIILDGIENIENLYEKNKCQQNKINQLEERNTNLKNKYEKHQELVKNMSIKYSNLKVKYAQQRLNMKEICNDVKNLKITRNNVKNKQHPSFDNDFTRELKRIKNE